MDPTIIIAIIFILIFSAIIHELAHGYTALYFGDPTAENSGRLTLNPISHLDFFGSIILPILSSLGGFLLAFAKPVPYNPLNFSHPKFSRKAQEALVAFAGPLSNIFLAIIFSIIFHILNFLEFSNPLTFEILEYSILINFILAIFNLIPVPPLDGSKILYYFLPTKNYLKFRNFFEKNTMIFFIILIAFIFFFPFIYKVAFFLLNILI